MKKAWSSSLIIVVMAGGFCVGVEEDLLEFGEHHISRIFFSLLKIFEKIICFSLGILVFIPLQKRKFNFK
jgi:hypothetical protein